jgi:predicted metalloprotease with PDZ domain
VLLDLLIRDATDNRKSLDDLMRELSDHFARPGRFYHDSADIRTEAERLAGRSLGDFFARYVAGTEELPYADLLARAGLVLKTAEGPRTHFGFVPVRGPEGAPVVTELEPGSAAEHAGVREGDVLLALNGAPFPRNAGRWLHERRPGETVRVRLRREGGERELSFALAERAGQIYAIDEVPDPTDEQRGIREGILRGMTDAP